MENSCRVNSDNSTTAVCVMYREGTEVNTTEKIDFTILEMNFVRRVFAKCNFLWYGCNCNSNSIFDHFYLLSFYRYFLWSVLN